MRPAKYADNQYRRLQNAKGQIKKKKKKKKKGNRESQDGITKESTKSKKKTQGKSVKSRYRSGSLGAQQESKQLINAL